MHADIAFTPDGRRLVASLGPEGTVRVWSTETGAELLGSISTHGRGLRSRAVIGVDVSPDGSRIATAGADGSARIFDAETAPELLVVRGRHCVRPRLCRCQPRGLQPGRLEDRHDRARTPPCGSSTRPRGRQLRVLRGHSAGRLGHVPGRVEPGRKRGSSRWRQMERASGTRAPAGSCSRCRPRSPGFSAAWSPDGRQVLTESGIGPVVWDASSGERLRTLETSAASGDMEFSRGRSLLANTTVDERGYAIRLWDWPAGVETLKLRDSGLRVALSPDGRLVATVRPRQPVPFVHVWALDPELLLQIARSRVTRSLTEEECRRYLQRPCSNGR